MNLSARSQHRTYVFVPIELKKVGVGRSEIVNTEPILKSVCSDMVEKLAYQQRILDGERLKK